MIILFYSEECKFCIKLIEYISTNNLSDFFKLINIDTLSTIPDNISIVPTIIDSTIEAPLEGKKAFEFVVNHKYFNHPTNNVDYWVNYPPPKPIIDEDKKALDKSVLTIYTNLDDINNKQIPQTTTQCKPIVKQCYNKPNITPVIAKKQQIQTNKPEINKHEINNNIKKNIALLKLRR